MLFFKSTRHKLLAVLLLAAVAILGPTATADTVDVSIAGFTFVDDTITVPVGTTVRWTNNDGPAHTSTSDPGGAVWDSGNLSNGQTYSYTFNTVGDYAYICAIHPSMKGMVKVAPVSGVPSISPVGALGLVLLLMSGAYWVYRRKGLAVTSH